MIANSVFTQSVHNLRLWDISSNHILSFSSKLLLHSKTGDKELNHVEVKSPQNPICTLKLKKKITPDRIHILHLIYLPFPKQWHPTPVLLPGKSHGRRSLVGWSPWGRWGSNTTERLHFHFSLSCIGEGNGNPLQCSCLENPRDGGAWWAAVSGVTQSRARLKRLSSSNPCSHGN